ncbi:MAG: hypothetical protein AB4426_23135 [Xenococcaceae cyanobacterium]
MVDHVVDKDFVNNGTIQTGAGNDLISGNASAIANLTALAVGVENNGTLKTQGGGDTINGTAFAQAGEEVEANGIFNTGRINLGAGSDNLDGNATAIALGNNIRSVDANGIINEVGGTITTAGGNDDLPIKGEATASAFGSAADINGNGIIDEEEKVEVLVDGLENKGIFKTGKGADVVEGIGSATTQGQGLDAIAGGIDNGRALLEQDGVFVPPEFKTGDGNDVINAEATANSNGANAVSDALSNVGKFYTGAGDDIITATAESDATNGRAVADGIDNRSDFKAQDGADQITVSATANSRGAGFLASANGIDNQGTINTGALNDVINASATADSADADAEAVGILNENEGVAGTILTGNGADQVIGSATATAAGNALALGISDINVSAVAGDADPSPDASVIDTGDDADIISGTAVAEGHDDVGATGVLLSNANTGAGNDTVQGSATATGVAATDARGISVGFSDIDDDTLANPTDTDGLIPAEVGQLLTGEGDDRLEASAHTTANAGDGDLFFANATAITNDGGTLEQLAVLLNFPGKQELLQAIDNGQVSAGDIEAVLPNLETSTLDTGAGNDTLDVTASINVTGGLQGGQVGGDPDLEVFVEGVENSGTLLLGDDDDAIVANVSGTSVGGAKILVEGIDNSGVGVSTGLDLDDQVNEQTVLDLGAGNDSITVTTDVRGEGDQAAGDGIDTRSNLNLGAGDDTIVLNVTSEFVRDPHNPGDQEEGIADGIENRKNVFLGEGNDSVTATVQATGNGILTIADGIESRAFFDAGTGNDFFDLDATAIASEGVLEENITVATGFQTEQFDSGELLLGDGNDTILARGNATSVVDGAGNPVFVNSAGELVDGDGNPVASVDRLTNKATFAFGISQVSGEGEGNGSNPDEAGLINTSVNEDEIVTFDDDLLNGTATAVGGDDVGAFGLLFTNATTGDGIDTLRGHATANGVATTDARGISVGLSDIDDDTLQNPEDTNAVLPAEVGQLLTGDGNDVLEASAHTTADAGSGDLFFANATAITNDGGTLAQLEALGVDLNLLARSVNGEELTEEEEDTLATQIGNALPALETSTLDTGAGKDTLDVTVSIHVTGGLQGGQVGGDPDLEVFVEGVENSGTLLLGDGDDAIVANVSGVSVGGAKILVEGIDNSGVGVSTGLDLGDQVNEQTLFNLGAGNDSITVTTDVRGEGDLAAGDGIDTRSNLDLGAGDDTIVLNVTSEFVRDQHNPGDQEEGIVDGIENRKNVFLGEGNDSVTVDAQATGNGILTIAEGIESRNFFDAGAGNDSLDLTTRAITGADALAGNLTQAAGLQTEQIDSGTFLLGDGNDSVVGNATATSDAVNDGVDTPSTFAFGITQMTADLNNENDAGLLDTSAAVVTTDNDTLDGTATATGQEDVAAFGLLFSNATTGEGEDLLRGNATADSPVSAVASGIAVGTDDVFVKVNSLGQQSGLVAEAGVLLTGANGDTIEGTGTATSTSGGVIQSTDANGIIVNIGSELNTDGGADTVTGTATASADGHSADAVLVDGIENKGIFNTGGDADVITGEGTATANGSEANVGGIDNGRALIEDPPFVAPEFKTGGGDDQIAAIANATVTNNTAVTDALSNVGEFLTQGGADTITATATSNADSNDNNDSSVADAIDNRGLLTTGADGDLIDADATAIADGNAFATANGIDNVGTINLVGGNDVLDAFASADSNGHGDAEAIGIFQDAAGVINLGGDDDTLIARGEAASFGGNAEAIGISGGTINAGAGNDNIHASSNDNLVGLNNVSLAGGIGFDDNVEINLQGDDDFLLGFGSAVVNGGSNSDVNLGGGDELAFEFSLADFQNGGGVIAIGNVGINEADFSFGGVTLSSNRFENFTFDNQTFDFTGLQGIA